MFSFEILSSYFIQGDVKGAISYLRNYPEAKEYLDPYVDLFENEHYLSFGLERELEEILLCYQKYFRACFYVHLPEKEAEHLLFEGLAARLSVEPVEELLEDAQKKLFEDHGYHYLGGKTNGHYGPYVWKTTKPMSFAVKLPQGVSHYQVNFVDDFILRSWMDYITFHQAGTAGWTDIDGTINCVAFAHDTSSEKFQVSLLKHEAQHVEDMKHYSGIVPSELEYRAKLVELIYSEDNTLLDRFLANADPNRPDDSHAVASVWLQNAFDSLKGATLSSIQEKARELLRESDLEMERKYRKK